jgi:hypothetical protein
MSDDFDPGTANREEGNSVNLDLTFLSEKSLNGRKRIPRFEKTDSEK